MRIFYAADSSPNPDFASRLWRANLHDSLVSIGHEVIEFQYDMAETFRHLDPSRPEAAAFIAQNRPRLGQALLAQIREALADGPVQVFFSYFYDACVEPAVIDAIRKLGLVTVNWFCNASYQLHLVREIAPHYDWCLVPEHFRLDDYRALGARPIYCQEAANPQVYQPRDVPVEWDIAFCGQSYGERPDIVLWLRAQKSRCSRLGRALGISRRPALPKPFAPRWLSKPRGLPPQAVGGILDDSALVDLYSRVRINLGFAAVDETRPGQRITQVRLRDFEVPMSGGFYLTEHTDELAEFFTPGIEIETWRTREELRDKCRYYLAHDEERRRIAAAGRARALREHTWEKRFTAAFQEMGLP